MVSLLAAVAATALPAHPPERQLSFTVFSAQPIANLAYVPYPDAAPVPLIFYPTARSPHYTYNGPSTVQLLNSLTGAVAAEISVPPGMRSALIILSAIDPPTTTAARYQVQVVDDSALRHAPGVLLILNFSGLVLSGAINRRLVILQDGLNAPIRVGEAATITLRTPFKDRSYQAYAETITLDKSSRALLLLLPPYRRGTLEVQSRVLVDAPGPEARESAAD